jgi:hypothetical protein
MRRFLLHILGAVLALAACSREAELPEPSSEPFPEGATVTIPFEVMGDDAGTPGTRTVELGEDTPLDNLFLAVFGGSGYLKEYVKAQNLSQIADTTYLDAANVPRTVSRYRFEATLTLTDNPRIIHFLGNGPTSLSFGYADAVLPSLLSGAGQRAYWQMKTVDGIRARKSEREYTDAHGLQVRPGDYIDQDGNKVRNGRGYVPDASTLNAFKGIPMVKNWAKLVVTSEEDSHFTPYSFAVVNVPTRGTIVPHSAATGFIADYQQYFHESLVGMGYPGNLPSGITFDTTIPSHEDFLNGGNGVARVSADEAVYLFERPVPTQRIPPSSIIVYGHYENPYDLDHAGDYYYKVDMMEDDEYYPVFRNFRYRINIVKILSQGHHTPAAAAAAAGSANVSADVSASHLADISDGRGRLVIDPYMSHTYTGRQTDGMLHAFFVDDVNNWHVNMDPAAVTVEKLPMPYGEADVIETLTIDDPIDHVDGSIGWRTIHFTTAEPGATAHTQTIRITGHYADIGKLYRDVVITLQPIQPMIVRCAYPRIAQIKGTPQTVEIVIPDGLAESMFPLVFEIEPEDRTLTPDGTRTNNNLPVTGGKSFSEHEGYSGKDTFHYLRTLSWDEYRSLATERDENQNTWRVLPCHFRSNCNDSATTVWVRNEYFYTACDRFYSSGEKSFQNLAFTTSIKREENFIVPVHFEVIEEEGHHYPDDYPVITISLSGMMPATEELIPVSGTAGTYTYKPSSSSVDLEFITTTDDGDLVLELSADEYLPERLRSHFFQDFGFVDGHAMWKTGGSWSNVALGYVNSDANKTVLFGYKDDPDAPNVSISLLDLQGLNPLTPTSYPWTPTGPRSNDGVQTYHEIEFRTPSGARNLNPVHFTLSAPGYVEEPVDAHRFYGNILTQNKIGQDVLKPNNTYGFSVETPGFTIEQNPGQTPKVTVTFDAISELRADAPKGLMLDAGGTYTMTVTSNTANYYMFYVQLNVLQNHTWNGVKRTLTPKEGTPSAGSFSLYPGGNNQFIWNLPMGTTSASLTLVADDDYPIVITDIILKSYKATFY